LVIMPAPKPPADISVYLERGSKRVFAAALEWPGWCRSGKDEGGALDALAAYGSRYAAVPALAKVPFSSPGASTAFSIKERLKGSATTDFGAPGEIAKLDRRAVTKEQAERLASLVQAAWKVLDRIAAGAAVELRKGPRGGGRDRDEVIQHVLAAESSYARKLDFRVEMPNLGDAPAIAKLRNGILKALRSAPGRVAVGKGWPPRYAAQRIAWHVLDHAWEIQDKSKPAPG
jgi:hypothetical protein